MNCVIATSKQELALHTDNAALLALIRAVLAMHSACLLPITQGKCIDKPLLSSQNSFNHNKLVLEYTFLRFNSRKIHNLLIRITSLSVKIRKQLQRMYSSYLHH